MSDIPLILFLPGHEVVEGALLTAAAGSERLSEGERIALADKLADAALGPLRRSQELARVAMKVRAREECAWR